MRDKKKRDVAASPYYFSYRLPAYLFIIDLASMLRVA